MFRFYAFYVVNINKDSSGNIISYLLDNGETIEREDGYKVQADGELKGLEAYVGNIGEKMIYYLH